jgi:phosphoenolpyruvate carboxykinase (GTP)
VLKWVFERCQGTAGATETAIGNVPRPEDLDTDGLELSPATLEALLTVDPDNVRDELPQVREHLARFGDRLPSEVRKHFELLERRLQRA